MESTRAIFNHEYRPVADAACSFCIICSHDVMYRGWITPKNITS